MKAQLIWRTQFYQTLDLKILAGGAGIFVEEANIHLINVAFRNNQAENGAALDLNCGYR